MSLLGKVGETVMRGVEAVLSAPAKVPVLRPVAKSVVKAGLVVTEKAKGLWPQTDEQAGREDRRTAPETSQPAAAGKPGQAPDLTAEVTPPTPAAGVLLTAEETLADEVVSRPRDVEAEPAAQQAPAEAAPPAEEATAEETEAEEGAEEPPWQHLRQIPDFTPGIAQQAWALGLRSFDDVRKAAEEGWLREQVRGIGEARQAKILAWLREHPEEAT